MAEITRAATGQRRAAYRYNALGERVRKSGTSVTYYHYDLEGRLLAETDASGQTRAEYLYLGNEPLALSRSGQLYYYHNDHLGTPQKLTDGAGQVVWSASYRPFGEASIGVGYVTRNLRFPGQYYDEESGLHYNYHRYYDPGTGRYLTSDPIGLDGGINTYLYANANPIIHTDPLGLFPGLGDSMAELPAWMPEWGSAIDPSGGTSGFGSSSSGGNAECDDCDQSFFDCLANCIRENDPLNNWAKAAGTVAGGTFPKSWANLPRGLGGASPVTTIPSAGAHLAGGGASGTLGGLARGAGRLFSPIWVGYGLGLAAMELVCTAACIEDVCLY